MLSEHFQNQLPGFFVDKPSVGEPMDLIGHLQVRFIRLKIEVEDKTFRFLCDPLFWLLAFGLLASNDRREELF
jgi:hypothetical protein